MSETLKEVKVDYGKLGALDESLHALRSIFLLPACRFIFVTVALTIQNF